MTRSTMTLEALTEIVRDIDTRIVALEAFTTTAIAALANGVAADEILDHLKTYSFNRAQHFRLADAGVEIRNATDNLIEEVEKRLTYKD